MATYFHITACFWAVKTLPFLTFNPSSTDCPFYTSFVFYICLHFFRLYLTAFFALVLSVSVTLCSILDASWNRNANEFWGRRFLLFKTPCSSSLWYSLHFQLLISTLVEEIKTCKYFALCFAQFLQWSTKGVHVIKNHHRKSSI